MATPKHSYKLTYFNARGAAELSRLVFKVAGVKFEDERLSEEWPSRKADMPLKALPVLEIDGKKMCQSAAIARYLAREFGLMGSDNMDALRIDELHEVTSEMISREIFKIFLEKDEAKKKELANTFVNEGLSNYLNLFEMRLKENNDGKGFYIGDKLTLGDLIVYSIMHMLMTYIGKLGVEPLKDRTLLKSHFDRVEAVPNIAEWIKSRPETTN